MYALKLATEAVTVGAVTVGGFSVVRSLLPNSSLYTQIFATGVVVHLSFEALGLNRWYLSNGAAALS
jgi:hypothetical protein